MKPPMRLRMVLILAAIVFIIASIACRLPGLPGPPAPSSTGQTPPVSSPAGTPAVQAASSPTPSPAPTIRPPTQPAPLFPDCLPAPVAAYQYNPSRIQPLPTPPPDQLTLRRLAERRGLFIGAGTSPSTFNTPAYVELLAREFNMVATENAMKWEVLHPEPERYDFSEGDAIVDFARANGMQVYAHVLAWDLQQPNWLTQGQHSRDEWIQILCRHIKTVVGHYRGQIYAWDVVNEAFQDNNELRDTLWLRNIGPEYIAMAFTWARQADLQALLIYNDFEAEGLNEKSDAIYSLVQGLQQQGIPIDGVGLQMHVRLFSAPTKDELAANMRRIAGLGLQVHITEMDVLVNFSPDDPARKLVDQAEVYRQAMSACLAQPACKVFITWGLSDQYSWKEPDTPLLFDRQFQPKPAYQAVWDELKRAQP